MGGGAKKNEAKKSDFWGLFFFANGAIIILMRMQIKGFWGNLGVIWVFFGGGVKMAIFGHGDPKNAEFLGGKMEI